MKVTIGQTSDVSPAASELARMHCTCMPSSLVSRLGVSNAEAVYRYCARSKLEVVFAANAQDTVVGGAWLSLAPSSLSRRLLFCTPLVPKLFARPNLALEWIRQGYRDARSRESRRTIKGYPGVIAIFVDASHRGRGVGAQLLLQMESFLRGRNVTHYVLRTEDSPENRAVAFYQREGFEGFGRHQQHGTWHRDLIKAIEPTNAEQVPPAEQGP